MAIAWRVMCKVTPTSTTKCAQSPKSHIRHKRPLSPLPHQLGSQYSVLIIRGQMPPKLIVLKVVLRPPGMLNQAVLPRLSSRLPILSLLNIQKSLQMDHLENFFLGVACDT